MHDCRHTHLVLLKDAGTRLRCRFCHLTLKPGELLHGYCPECYEIDGQKRDEFDEIPAQGQGETHYRCEDCGVVLTPFNGSVRS
jgi:predicted RNA-binding Zn-ribbon protein involved in translation (DUF1610 family)